jgi:D-alanine-D-alanine ligase
MYICVLSSPPDPDDVPYDPSAYFTEHRWEHIKPHPQNYRSELANLARKGFDAFINLCDGTPDDELSGIGLVQVLEEFGLPFTGADSTFFDPTRQEMKEAAKHAGVPVPGCLFVEKLPDLGLLDHTLRYPLLVKPPHGYASIGISRESRVTNQPALETQTTQTIEKFGSALIEEFIDGREFTVLIAENANEPCNPVTFRPIEFVFPPGENFKHYDMKWKDYARMSARPVADLEIDQRLRDFTTRQFLAMRGCGYARCDFRMDQNGEIYLLEINPNCGVFYPPHEPGSADFVLLNDPLGHAGFLDLIVRSAIKRKRPINIAKEVR